MAFADTLAGSDLYDPSDQKKVEDILETVGLHPAQMHVQGILAGGGDPEIPGAAPTGGMGEAAKQGALLINPGPKEQPPASDTTPPVRIPSPMSPGGVPAMAAPAGAAVQPLIRSPQETNAVNQTERGQNELARMNRTGSGISQIKNPFLRNLARVGDIAGTALFPSITANIPGTELHHQILENQQERLIGGGLAQQKSEAETEEAKARADALEHPERQVGKTPEDKAIADWQTQVNPDTGKNYTASEAFVKAEEAKQEVKPENKDRQLTRYAELRNKQSDQTTPLTPAEQTEFGTLQTKFSVGGDSAKQYNASIVRELAVNPKTAVKDVPPELEVKPTDTDAEAKEKLARAQALVSGATGQQHVAISLQQAGNAAGTKADARADKSFQYNNTALDKVGTPIDQLTQRVGRLQDTLAQHSPQSDALVAPELLSVMAGGAGSGLRMNEAEIARIVGGRSAWENLKASIQHWSTTPADARSITPAQDQQIRALIAAVNTKLIAKTKAIDDAREGLIDTDDPKEHRRIVADTKKKLDSIDAGGNAGPAGTTHFVRGNDHWDIPADKIDAFKKAHPDAKAQ